MRFQPISFFGCRSFVISVSALLLPFSPASNFLKESAGSGMSLATIAITTRFLYVSTVPSTESFGCDRIFRLRYLTSDELVRSGTWCETVRKRWVLSAAAYVGVCRCTGRIAKV